jgi:hypothetical protein
MVLLACDYCPRGGPYKKETGVPAQRCARRGLRGFAGVSPTAAGRDGPFGRWGPCRLMVTRQVVGGA